MFEKLLDEKCMAEGITKESCHNYFRRREKAEKLWEAARTLCSDGYLTHRECKCCRPVFQVVNVMAQGDEIMIISPSDKRC